MPSPRPTARASQAGRSAPSHLQERHPWLMRAGSTGRRSPRSSTARRSLPWSPTRRSRLAAQFMPTGIDRVDGRLSAAAKIDGIDERVDADVAIVDTGIAWVADLNVAGGYNCSTVEPLALARRPRPRDAVAGTVGAIDNGTASSASPRASASGGQDPRRRRLRPPVAGTPVASTGSRPSAPGHPRRPRFEAVNMSVTKWGADDGACGARTPTSSMRRSAGSSRAASRWCRRANDSGERGGPGPRGLQRGDHVSALADSDGKPGGGRRNRCYSWGTYDNDDSFANFSNSARTST